VEKVLTNKIHNLFSIPLYISNVEQYNEIDNIVTEEIIDSLVTTTPNGWNCDVDTSFLQKTKDITWVNSFLQIIRPKIIDHFVVGYNTDKVNLKMDLPWINRYNKGQWQERHNHLAADAFTFSYCYYHKLPNEDGCAKFMFRSNNSDHEHLTPNLVRCQVSYKPDIKEHDIIIFPSWVDHLVTTHNLHKPRITISGNFSVTIKPH
jgi:hypothetical protein